MDAQSAHYDTCRDAPAEVTHIRRQIARKRGDGFYKVKYGPTEDGLRRCAARTQPAMT